MLWSYRLIGLASLLANAATLAFVTPSSTGRAAAAPPAGAARAKIPASIRTDRSSDGLFHLEGQANGRSATMVLDTGASVTVLTEAHAERLGATPIANLDEQTLQTAGGPTRMAWYRLKGLQIAGRRVDTVDVAVVPAGFTHSLLGQDVLAQLGAIVLDGDTLEIRPRA